jgi:hypothetical protein
MNNKSLISLTGFLLLVVGCFCPLISPFGLVKWNVFDLNFIFGVIIICVAALGILSIFFQQPKLGRLMAWAALALVVLLLAAAVFKVNTSFSFIPFKNVGKFLSEKVYYRWGWYVLFAGPLLAVLGSLEVNPKPQQIKQDG